MDQDSDSELLVKYGFFVKEAKEKYKFEEKKQYYVPKPGKKGEETALSADDADEEYDEEVNLFAGDWSKSKYYKTGYPNPKRRYKLVYEAFNMSLEELYFWSINHIRQDAGFPYMIKITDIFSASENSAFFGQSAQRLSIQEDRASSFLRGLSDMIKTLFQIVREIRIIDERLDIYSNWKKSKSADSSLKSLFADFAENKGGQMQPGSIYHLSNQVGYATLPDLFFNTVVFEKDDVDKIVEGMGFNNNVKAVLKRKLYQFIVWKEKTEKELTVRRKFQVKYLRQHYTVIKMYMSWVKPYLKHIKRLTMNEQMLDSPDLISSFETSSTEIEVVTYKPIAGSDYCATAIMTFKFATRPVLQYKQEYNQGPIHIGRGTMILRSYSWTKKQIDMYKKMKDSEDRELMGLVDDQLKAAMEMLGDDLEKYLKETEEELEERIKGDSGGAPIKGEKLKKLESQEKIYDPFVEIFKGLAEMGKMIVPRGLFKSEKPSGPKGKPDDGMKTANAAIWMVYNNYKKAHGLLSW